MAPSVHTDSLQHRDLFLPLLSFLSFCLPRWQKQQIGSIAQHITEPYCVLSKEGNSHDRLYQYCLFKSSARQCILERLCHQSGTRSVRPLNKTIYVSCLQTQSVAFNKKVPYSAQSRLQLVSPFCAAILEAMLTSSNCSECLS